MIVLDASVVVELLVRGPLAKSIEAELASAIGSYLVPHFLEIEVISAVRKLAAGQRLDSHRVSQLLDDLAALPAERYAHTPLLPRIWELRHRFTAYDATYIALAEATNATLYTADQKLTSGHAARVFLFKQ